MKEILDLIKSFKFKDAENWFKGYFLVWTSPCKFWQSIFTKSSRGQAKQALFYSVISGLIIFIFFYAGNDEVGVMKVLLGQLFSFSTVVIPTLIVSAFFLKKYRTLVAWLQSTIVFAIFFFLLIFPIDLILASLFLEFEEVNFLLIHNYLSGPISFIYIFIVSSAVFYRSKVAILVASLVNILFVNLLLYAIYGLLISSEISKEKRVFGNLDQIQKEYLVNRTPFINIQSIPFRIFSFRDSLKRETIVIKEFVAINNVQSTRDLELVPIVIDTSKPVSTNISLYIDTLNGLIHVLDSLESISKYTMNKKVFASEANFYRQTVSFLTHPIDTSKINIKCTFYIGHNKLNNSVDTLLRIILVVDESRRLFNSYLKDKHAYERKFKNAYFLPKWIMKYLHFAVE